MKRNIKLTIIILLTILLIGCGEKDVDNKPMLSEINDGTYKGSGVGYGGPLNLEVVINDGKIENINVTEHGESSPVFSRALPILEERILEDQSPLVDSVSGATFTSLAVKTALSEALKEQGQDFGKITISDESQEVELEKLEDVETDIVIIGGGPAGLSAAISAKESGVEDIILIEKLDILGGNGKFDMNFYDMINSKAQKDKGIELGINDFIEMKEKAFDSPERIEVWAEGSFKVDEWFRNMGIELNYAYGKTNHMREEDEYAGEHIHDNLEAKIKELGIDVRTGSKGLDIIMEDEKVVGVEVENKDGYYNIKTEAVIIATGGFASNKDLLEKYAPGAEVVATSNQIGTTGDFIEIFEENGFQLTNMDRINVFPFIVKKTRDLTGGADDFILVNEDGKRFVTEEGRGLKFAHIILDQPGGRAFYIYDQIAYESAYRLQKHVNLGYHTKAETLNELANELGIDSDNLESTVQTYNSAINGEIEDPFRGADVSDRKFAEDGPYYGVAVESAIHMTLGGVVANEKAQIVDSSNQIVEGLYAAGEVTNVSGAFNASVVFGRIAGEESSKYVLGK